MLTEWEFGAAADDAEMVVSELVTNALQASWALEERSPVALRLLANGERLLIEVWDQSPAEPVEVPGTLHPMVAGAWQ